jgi:predicted dehydrogenase
MPECKVGVVGAGKMGEYHIGVLSEMRATDLVGIVDSDQERAKIISERYNVPSYGDYKELISKVDVVVIAVPTSLHYSVGKEFLEAGVHTLLERPCQII